MKATAVKELIRQLMPAIRNNPVTRILSINQQNILQYISYVAFLHGTQSRSGAIYATPSEERIAKIVHVHRVTVSRNVSALKSLGLLNVTNRRPEKDKFKTNLYKFSKLFWAAFSFIINRFRKYFNRVTPMLHIVSKEHNIYLKNNQKRNGPIRNNGPTAIDVIKLMEKLHPELV